MLKSQYGASKDQNTPKSHKRKNYKGIGAQKKKSKPAETAESNDTEARTIQTKEKRRTTNDAVVDDSPTDSYNSVDTIGSDILEDSNNRYLESLIQEEIEPRTNSKAPKKQARQMFPFRCSECNAKYKTQTGYTKHLREKHGMI